MFTPTPPRPETPVSRPQEKAPYPDISWPRPPSYTPKNKILWQAILGGSAFSAAFSFLLAGLGFIITRSQETDFFADRWREPFLTIFIRLFASFFPFFCVLVGVATAVDVLLKRGGKRAQLATEELVKALHQVAQSLRRENAPAMEPERESKNPHYKDPHLELGPGSQSQEP